jgi:hypothetical protein
VLTLSLRCVVSSVGFVMDSSIASLLHRGMHEFMQFP